MSFEVDDNVMTMLLAAMEEADARRCAFNKLEAESARTWQPIETAPKDKDILVWGRGLHDPIAAFYKDATVPASSGWHYAMGGGRVRIPSEFPMQFEFTHWMPLPSTPEEQP
jgi:hypothetical protein